MDALLCPAASPTCNRPAASDGCWDSLVGRLVDSCMGSQGRQLNFATPYSHCLLGAVGDLAAVMLMRSNGL